MVTIQFDHVGKLYRLGTVGTGTLSHDLNRWWKTRILHQEDPYLKIGETNDRATHGHSDYVWALKDISFNVEQGDVVGIIGKNGAGKSTLLKLLSQITTPTTGTIRARGRIGSLLEVGTGFHPEMTGRENIYMNGAIMGMTRHEITCKLDEIIDFAGVARYIDTPVKRYSSGMTVRLGFAVAAFMEPEILVVDEVLAVGDAEFQKKAIGKMQDVSKGEGRTVLFVSHNMAAVRSLCTRSIVIKNGNIDFDGQTEAAISHYLRFTDVSKRNLIKSHIRWTKDYLHIDKIEVNGTDQDYSIVKSSQTILPIRIEGWIDIDMQTDLIVLFKTTHGSTLATLAEGYYKGKAIGLKKGRFVIERNVVLPQYMCYGDYVLDIIMKQPSSEYQMGARQSVMLHVEEKANTYGKALNNLQCGLLGLDTVII